MIRAGIRTCPSWPILLAWIENDLPEEESQLLNTHVADCEECREKLALMNAVQDVGSSRSSRGRPLIKAETREVDEPGSLFRSDLFWRVAACARP